MLKPYAAYMITCDSEKCTYSTESWSNQTSTGKLITLEVVSQMDVGFTIYLTADEKKGIVKKTHIELNDYACVPEMDEGVQIYKISETLLHLDTYDVKELDEINYLIYQSPKKRYNDDDNKYGFNKDLLKHNGWNLRETTYTYTSGCVLELINQPTARL